MSGFGAFLVILCAISCGGLIVITLGSIWIGTAYYIKKRGYGKASAQRKLEQLRLNLSEIKDDIDDLKTYVADLTIRAHDAARFRES